MEGELRGRGIVLAFGFVMVLAEGFVDAELIFVVLQCWLWWFGRLPQLLMKGNLILSAKTEYSS